MTPLAGKTDAADHHGIVVVQLNRAIAGHLLGMRILRFAKTRFPSFDIVVHSIGEQDDATLLVASLSPHVKEAIHTAGHGQCDCGCGFAYFLQSRSATTDVTLPVAHVLDATGDDMLAAASMTVEAPLFEILAARPELAVPREASRTVEELLLRHHADALVAMHSTADMATGTARRLVECVLRLLAADGRLIVADLQGDASGRAAFKAAAASERIVDCSDAPIDFVVALLARSSYFIGPDGDMKALAWALGTPRTFFRRDKPPLIDALWPLPDLHRLLLYDSSDTDLRAHLAELVRCLEQRRLVDRADAHQESFIE